ncbi:MAG: hypothetical protein H7A25_25610 [Leptospiraceae bacterium]|nr:hypothetical protein [Leptospiraceae bacterium]MCP5503301.1 hypothetical protein [Leptospiraceae bacterium]
MQEDKALKKKLSSIKDLDSWVEFILSSSILPQKKSSLTKIWLNKNGFMKEDLDLARKNNLTWKKMVSERTKKRRLSLETKDNFLNRNKKWTNKEVQKLKKNIDKPERELLKMFNRSLQSINAKKRSIRMEEFGISLEKNGAKWTRKELDKLKKNYNKSNLELAKSLKRTPKSIQRQKERLKSTGLFK